MTHLEGDSALLDELSSIRKWMHRVGSRTPSLPSTEAAVIYARFSDRKQKEVSIEIQVDWCRSYAAQQNIDLLPEHVFADRARTGDSLDGRSALAELRRLAGAGAFRKIIVYGMDRLSRRASHAQMLYDEFTALGIEVHVASGSVVGRIDGMMACILSLFAQEERERLLRNTSFAAWRAAARGTNMGCVPYGYRKGGKRGEVVIEEEEMRVVIRIFILFVHGGLSPTQIAYLLNKDGIRTARGGLWTREAIAGRAGRGGGILRNPMYMGWYIYGVLMTVRTPGKAKTTRVIRSPKHWVKKRKEELGRIDVNLWCEANDRLDAMGRDDCDASLERRSRYTLLLRGQYHCVCGSRMNTGRTGGSKIHKLLCKAALEHGTCERRRSTSSVFVETEILREMRDNILSDEAIGHFQATYLDELKRSRDEAAFRRRRLEARIAEIDRWMDASVLSSINAGCTEAHMIRLREEWNAERDRLLAELVETAMPDQVDDVSHADLVSVRAGLDRLIMRMPISATSEEDMLLIAALRRMISRVTVDRKQGDAGYALTIEASLANLPARNGKAAEGVAVRTFTRKCPAPHKGKVNMPELLALAAEKTATDEWATTDQDWAAVAPLWEDCRNPKKRFYLDAILFYLRIGTLGYRRLPPPYDERTVSYGIQMIASTGLWRSAYDALVRIDSPTVAGLDLSRLKPCWRECPSAHLVPA